MKTTIIEMTGRVASGKSTVKNQLIGRRIQNRQIQKAQRAGILRTVSFIGKHAGFFMKLVCFTVKRGSTRHNSVFGKLIKLLKIFQKWAYAHHHQGIFLIDEGFCKFFSPQLVLSSFPAHMTRLAVIHVTVDETTRKNRIAERMKIRTIKPAHQIPVTDPAYIPKQDTAVLFWEKKASEENFPSFVIDTSPSAEDWDTQIEKLFSFLQEHIPAD